MSNEEKTALETEREQMETAAAAENKSRTGKGLRVKVGSTRGRSVSNIKYESFDESLPETLPTTIDEFCNLTGVSPNNAELVPLLIVGFNDKAYTDASDPISDYINPAWPADLKLQFRTVVRNMAKMYERPIAEVAAEIKVPTDKKFAASQA